MPEEPTFHEPVAGNMDWRLIRFLVVIFALAMCGVGMAYVLVQHPEWQIASDKTTVGRSHN